MNLNFNLLVMCIFRIALSLSRRQFAKLHASIKLVSFQIEMLDTELAW